MSLDYSPIIQRLAEIDAELHARSDPHPADPPAKRALHEATGAALQAERDYLTEALRQLKRWPT